SLSTKIVAIHSGAVQRPSASASRCCSLAAGRFPLVSKTDTRFRTKPSSKNAVELDVLRSVVRNASLRQPILHMLRPVATQPQLTAFFTSAPILTSSAAPSSFSAKAVGHMWPSSRFALSLKPSVAYLVLNFCALWKKQTPLPSLAYAGIPYQVFGERAGALALIIAWSRSPMARSGCGSAAIFASTALSPSALSARRPRRASAFSSWRRSLIATRSSSVNPLGFFSVAVVLLGDFCVLFFAGFIVLSFPTGSRLSACNRRQPPNLMASAPRCVQWAHQ